MVSLFGEGFCCCYKKNTSFGGLKGELLGGKNGNSLYKKLKNGPFGANGSGFLYFMKYA